MTPHSPKGTLTYCIAISCEVHLWSSLPVQDQADATDTPERLQAEDV